MKQKKPRIKQCKNKISALWYAFIVTFIFSFSVSAQTKTLSGKVTDQETNLPLPGVNILIKGTTTGTVTDFDGNYSLTLKGDNPVIEFSYLGYETQTIKYNNQSILNISLVAELDALDEVVVIGYGTSKKSDLTGAVSSVKGTSIEKQAPVSFQNALAGRVAGVQITQTDNGPGSGVNVLIRGGSSLTSGNQPLYVIDGFPIVPDGDPQSNPLADISPGQIESIEILKDASATAIFGAQGANGVILITTKLGVSGKPAININANFGVSELSNYLDLFTPEEFPGFIIQQNELFNYIDIDGQQSSIQYWQDVINNGVQGKDWLKEITRVAQTQDLNITYSGGNNGLRYSVSGNYLNQDGIIIGSNFNRLNVNFNVEQKIGDKIKIGSSTKVSLSENTGLLNSWEQTSIIKTAIQSNPYIDDDFNVAEIDVEQENQQWNNENVVNYLNTVDNEFKTSRIITNMFFEYDLSKSLTFYTSYGFNRYYKNQHQFYPKNTQRGLSYGGLARLDKFETNNQVFQARLNYKKSIKKHRINLTGVFENRSDENLRFRSEVQGFEDDSRGIYDLSTASIALLPRNIYTDFSLQSFLGRANYTYGGKYLLTASLRADGSSRFGKDNKWGYFPSIALGWVASREKFIKNLNTFNLLKFRLSYGVTGNNQIPSYSSLASLATERYVFDNNLFAGVTPGSIANPDLKWEKTAQYNVGIDMGFFKNRLSITAEAYYKKTTDLLLDVQLPSTSGFSTALKNIGSISNKGLEFTINSVNIDKKDFRWSSAFTLSTNRSEVLDLGESQEMFFTRNFFNKVNNDILVRVGEQIGIYYGFVEDEVLNSENEIANSPENTVLENIVGQVKLYDVNGDGIITLADKVPIAKTVPDFIGGFSNEFTYKNFDLSFMLRWSYGNDVINGNVTFLDRVGRGNWNTLRSFANNQFSPINPSGTIHGSVPDTYSTLMRSSYVEDGSFLKMDFITLGYRLPESVLDKFGLTNLRIYGRVDNPFMITRYSWFDPEVSTGFGTPARVGPGADVGTYPRATTINLGLSIGL